MRCEWKEVQLRDAPIEIIDGDRGKNYPKQDEFSSSGFCLFLNAKNVTVNGFSFSEKMFINEEKDSLLRKGRLRRNDVVLTTRGTVGNVAFYSNAIPFENVRINSGMVILRANKKYLLPNYLYLLMRSSIIQSQIRTLMSGSAQPQLPISSMINLAFPLPPLPEQKTIAATLTCLDDKIELNNRINANLEAQAQAIFKNWFVDFEPFQDGAFEDSELGPIPKGWKIVHCNKFLNHNNEKSNDAAIPEYSVTNTGLYPRSEKFKKKLSSSKSMNKIIHKNDLVFGMSRKILNWGLMKEEIGGVSSAYHVFSIDEKKIDPSYLEEFMMMKQRYFLDIIKPAAREGQGIDKSALLGKTIYIPPQDTYEEYTIIRDTLNNKISVNHEQNQTLAAIRDALLPKLMSGEIEIPMEVQDA